MTDPKVTLVTVCYNSGAVLPTMLDSVPPGTPVILVDNASSDPQAVAALADRYGATLLKSRTNIGFGRACNLGAAAAKTEFLLFLNPDAALQDGALEALLKAALAHPKASAFNPRLLDQKHRQSFRRGSKIRPAERFKGPVPTADTEVPILTGSAIFCRKALFDQISGFDPQIFMYHEDDDLTFRCRVHGPTMYCHDAKVVHVSGHGAPRSPEVAGFKAYHSARSRAYVLGKYGHPRPLLNTLVAAVFRLLGPDTLFIKRRRAKNLGYLKGAISALRDGGRFADDGPGGA